MYLFMPYVGRKFEIKILYSCTLDTSFIKGKWDCINNCPSYKCTCKTTELYEDIADLLPKLQSHYNNNKKPYYFHNKSDKNDLHTQTNTSDWLQKLTERIFNVTKPFLISYV